MEKNEPNGEKERKIKCLINSLLKTLLMTRPGTKLASHGPKHPCDPFPTLKPLKFPDSGTVFLARLSSLSSYPLSSLPIHQLK